MLGGSQGSAVGVGQEKQRKDIAVVGQELASHLRALPAEVGCRARQQSDVSARMLVGLCAAMSVIEPRLVSRFGLDHQERSVLNREWVNWGQQEGLASPRSLFGCFQQSMGGRCGLTPPAMVPCLVRRST